ncbi:MAG: T9SS type A sorting domain-containing protein [Ignavibacteria bacterium]|nr:T9SS type A sorting domain-containing protein [Ignavibacteria bacterium]
MDFEYCAGQFTWSYNKAIQAPGKDLFFGLFGAGTSLPPAIRPPAFQVDSVNGYLKMAGNLPQSLVNYFISGTAPGTRILTAQLRTDGNAFQQVPLDLRFKLGASPNTFVAAFAPYPDTAGFDSETFPNQTAIALMDTINPPGDPVYTVENGGFVLPVELASFAANVNKNNVVLNWTTTTETNNQGFDIERSLVGSNEWTKAGNVSGNGTTNEAKSYSFAERLTTGHYNYRLKQIDFNGGVNYHNLSNEVVVGVPSVYALSQNYPNPFNPTTKIDFELPYDGKVSVLLYDISGREVAKLVNEVKTAGYYSVQFNGANLASGMYFYRINAEGNSQNFVSTKKMVLIK